MGVDAVVLVGVDTVPLTPVALGVHGAVIKLGDWVLGISTETTGSSEILKD